MDFGSFDSLFRAARRSPHLRRALHDKLLEVYPGYDVIHDVAQRRADHERIPMIITASPICLRNATERWGRAVTDRNILRAEIGLDPLEPAPIPAALLLEEGAFHVRSLADLRRSLGRNQFVEQQIVSLRPR